MTNRNKITLLLLIASLSLVLFVFSIGKDAIQINRHADSAIFEQIIENIHSGKGAVSSVFSSTQHFIDKLYFTIPFNEIINTELTQPKTSERNILSFHAYWLLFILAPLISFFDSSIILSFVHTASYFGLLCCVAHSVLRVTEDWILVLALGFIVFFCPVFIGSLMGQFYPDRIFILFGYILCYFVYFRVNIIATIVVAIIVVLLNERAALIGGGVMLALPFTNKNKYNNIRKTIPYLVIGGLMLTYSFYVKTYILSNLYYNNFLPSSLEELNSNIFKSNTFILIIANIPLLIASFGKPKLGLISLLFMLPNIIGNVGGAEKVGWLTHYHSYYFPILTFSAVVGYSEWISKIKKTRKICFLIISIIGVMVISFNEVNSKRLPSVEEYKKNFTSFIHLINRLPTGYDIRNDVISKIPFGKNVVTDELGMALLKNHANVSLFPLSVKDSDYLFISCRWNNHGIDSKAILPLEWFNSNGFETKVFTRIHSIDRCFYRKIR